EGPGAGQASGLYGAGGSYGGVGAVEEGIPASYTYGSLFVPDEDGSGGGGPQGGYGGGVLFITVADTLTVNGTIAADGGNAVDRSGGGSGGSVYIIADTLTGSGMIGARGGRGGDYYGYHAGGGGGRVAVYCNTNLFTGTFDVAGGATNGQEGTARLLLLTPTELTQGVPGTALIETIQTPIFVFEVTPAMAASGSGLLLSVETQAGDGNWNLYGRFGGAVPGNVERWSDSGVTRTDAYAWFEGIPVAGMYYLCTDYLPPEGGDTVTPEVRVTAQLVDRYVDTVSTYEGSNNRSITVTIAGIGFEQGVQVELRDAEGVVIATFTPSSGTSSSMSVTFTLLGLAPGDYEIVVIWPDAEEYAIAQMFVITGQQGTLLKTIAAHTSGIGSVMYNADGTQLLSGSDDRSACRWSTATGDELKRYLGHSSGVRRAVFSPDELEVATGSYDSTMRLWDSDTGDQLGSYSQSTGGSVNTVAFDPDGDHVFTGYNNGEGVAWDLDAGVQALYFGSLASAVTSSQYFFDGLRLVTGHSDGNVRLWDGATGDLLATFATGIPGAVSAAFSPDARRVVTGGASGTVQLWDVLSGSKVLDLVGHDGQQINGVAFSPDGNYMLSAGDNGKTTIWHASRGIEIMTLTHPGTSRALSADFSPDGSKVATSHANGQILIWLTGLRAMDTREAMNIALGQTVIGEAMRFEYEDYLLNLGMTTASNVIIRLTPDEAAGQWRLLGSLGMLPTLAMADWTAVPAGGGTAYEIIVPGPISGALYFSLYYAEWSKFLSGGYTLECIEADTYLSGISPDSGLNAGVVTANLVGAGFEPDVVVELRSSGGALLTTGTVSSQTTTKLTFACDLSGVTPQTADVVVVWSDMTEEILPAAFEIEDGTEAVGPILEAFLEAPSEFRNGRVYTLWLEYANVGDMEMPAPLFVVSSRLLKTGKADDGTAMRLSGDRPWQYGSLQILGVSPVGNPSVLSPGVRNRVPIYFMTSNQDINFTLGSITDENCDVSINWASLELDMRPDDISDADWTTLWPLLLDELGNTWCDYLATLGAYADILGQRGEDPSDVDSLMELISSSVFGSSVAAITGTLLDADTGAPIEGVNILAQIDGLDIPDEGEWDPEDNPEQYSPGIVYEAVTGPGGSFIFTGVIDGTYSFYVEDHYFDTTPFATVQNQM
ncbi:MAG: hypothetical protein KAH38_04770, partial [Candidatus Hydrogenedentes bacterium]|nr:hypothetical protein [Candidatus Hydrogenedentota bacterium]